MRFAAAKHDSKRMQHFNRRAAAATLARAALLLLLQPALAERVERAGLIVDGVSPAPAALTAAWERYAQAPENRLLGWLADDSLLIARRDGRHVRAYRTGPAPATPEPLTFLEGDVGGAAAHPYDPQRLAVRLLGTDGHARLYAQRVGEPSAQPLTGPGAHDDAPLWAHDGRQLAFASDRRNGRDFDVYLIEAGSAAGPRLIIGGGGRWRVLDWALDDRALLLRREDGPHDERLFIASVADGSLRSVDAPRDDRPERARVPAARFTPDGRAILYLRDAGPEGFVRLQRLGLDDSVPRDVTPPLEHDVDCFDIGADGRYLAYAWEDNGFSRLAILDQRSREPVVLPRGLPLGIIRALRFDRGGTRLAIETDSSTTPASARCATWPGSGVLGWSAL